MSIENPPVEEGCNMHIRKTAENERPADSGKLTGDE